MRQISYAFYRRLRESNVCPQAIVNWLWGKSNKDLKRIFQTDSIKDDEDIVLSKKELKRISAEIWGEGIEEQMIADNAKGKDSYVHTGFFIGGGVKAGNEETTSAEVSARAYKGRMLKPVFDWFSEGHGLPDLMAAKSMLRELA